MEPLSVDADLPPAARHVAHVLQERGPCTQPELVEITTLPETTVDDALARLVEEGLVDVTQRWGDARGHRYELD
ncbi:MarR family transcriptional regulator [Halolamina rubra]|uniref:MarR family transcriptional regulator n=1 Tax=Halolamina rubra TaxID=1380430 RepID=UPI00067900CF|nr:MarR family transcriptional regulator [Halolamina rubra]